jgi:Cys-rich repeat protein
MSRWQPPRVLGWFVASLLALSASCATDTPDATSGSLSIDLVLRGDTDIDEVTYRVSGNGIDPIEGAIDTSAPGTTYSLEVFGLAEAKNYQVEMMATTVDKTTTCAGVAQFDVVSNQITLVYLVLRCGRPEALGGVRVNASINYCAEIMTAVAAPWQTSVGNDIEVYVVADDWERDGVEYRWAATGGIIADPTAEATTYTCTEVGNQSIAVRISDDGFDYCRDEKTFAVRCVDGGGPECETNDHCEDLEICVGNQCVPDVECTDDAQCAPGEICVQDMCVPAPPECTDDAHCIQGEVCVNNTCVPAPPECTDDGQCDAGEVCVDNTCVPAPPECTQDSQCAPGEVCENNECVPAPPECTQDSHCAFGEVCVNNECVPAPPECTHNGQCITGEVCVRNQCVPGECTHDLHCGLDRVCVNNQCEAGPPECTQDWHCDAGYICVAEECVWGGANRCPFFIGGETTPVVQSSGNLIDVWSRVLDQDGDPVEVRAESNCGPVTQPLLVPNSAGESETTVRCESVGPCFILLSVSDDGFTDCDGTTILSGRIHTPIQCQP